MSRERVTSGEGLSYVESTFHLVSLEADEKKDGIDTVESLCLMGRDLELGGGSS